jgi:heterodisulfide reductase subunit B
MESEGVPIERSLMAVAKLLDIQLKELEGWTCCGCPGAPIHELYSVSIAARNLALAEKTGLDLVAPCSCCYRNLKNAHVTIVEDKRISPKVNEALSAVGLHYGGGVKVRHLIDVFVNDIGLGTIASKVKVPLRGLKTACWYGCHETRPYGPDNFEFPMWLDQIMETLGASPVEFPLKAQCCGGAQLISQPDMALKLVWKLLDNATDNGAVAMTTTLCPLCHSNVDATQMRVNKRFKTRFEMPVLASTQVMGLAFGLTPKEVGLDKNIVPWEKVLSPYLKVKA